MSHVVVLIRLRSNKDKISTTSIRFIQQESQEKWSHITNVDNVNLSFRSRFIRNNPGHFSSHNDICKVFA